MQGRFPAPETRGSGLARVLALVDAYLDGLGSGGASMAKAVAAGVADGTVRADADPDAAAVALVALMRGVDLQRLLAPDAVGLDAVRAEVGRLLQGGLVG